MLFKIELNVVYNLYQKLYSMKLDYIKVDINNEDFRPLLIIIIQYQQIKKE